MMQNLTGNNEWRTPSLYINAVKNVLGEISIDPASNAEAQAYIQAKTYYTANNSGLNHSWEGKCFMNPPYSRDLIPKFANKFVKELEVGNISSGIVLVNSATDTGWFHLLHKQAAAMCLTKGRIGFLKPGDRYGDSIGKKGQLGTAFLYFGKDVQRFISEFDKFGLITLPVGV